MNNDLQQVKDYLNQVKEADKMINFKQERLDELKAQSFCIRSPDYSSDKVQTSPTGDAIPRIIAKIIDLQEEINADIDKFIDLKAEIMRVVDSLKCADEIVIIYAKYFEYKTIQEIADETHHCRRTIQRLHKSALKKLSPLVTCIVTGDII